MDIFMFANSPGEVWAWARPTIKAILEEEEDACIFVVIPPCPYASGGEMDVLSKVPGIHRIICGREFLKLTLIHPFPNRIRKHDNGVVVHMGGDMFNTALFATRMRLPAVAYTHRFMGWHGPYKQYMAADERTRDELIVRKVPPKMITVTGDLMTDVVSPQLSRDDARNFFEIEDNELLVSLFPGSREYEIRYVAPFLLRVAELITQGKKDVKIALSLSPFLSMDKLKKALDPQKVKALTKVMEGAGGTIEEGSKWSTITTSSGLSIPVISGMQYDLMTASDLALCSPGTATAELATLGVPMLAVAPLNKAEDIAIDGLLNYASKIPFFGKNLKRKAVWSVAAKTKYAAIPNKKAGKPIVPEFVGILDPPDVAFKAIELLKDDSRRSKISKELIKTMGEKGAAKKVAQVILDTGRKAGDGS